MAQSQSCNFGSSKASYFVASSGQSGKNDDITNIVVLRHSVTLNAKQAHPNIRCNKPDINGLAVAIGGSHYNEELLIACISSPVINDIAYDSVIGSNMIWR
ncbi:hypothetical protein J6590_063334 [Homalodisca vitripennis]|nr:hypothetical protein J6590_063334 [Homalodisca vitripennis]